MRRGTALRLAPNYLNRIRHLLLSLSPNLGHLKAPEREALELVLAQVLERELAQVLERELVALALVLVQE